MLCNNYTNWLDIIQKWQTLFIGDFHHDIEVTDSVNKILLVAYYLVNLGFSTIMVSFCNDYKNPLHNAELYAIKLGIILWSLGGLHYCNVVLLNHFKIQIQLFFHPKNSSI